MQIRPKCFSRARERFTVASPKMPMRRLSSSRRMRTPERGSRTEEAYPVQVVLIPVNSVLMCSSEQAKSAYEPASFAFLLVASTMVRYLVIVATPSRSASARL